MLFWISIVTFFTALAVLIQWLIGIRKLPILQEQQISKNINSGVSIVVAAKNEEARIYEAVSSMLSIESQQLEVIAVNDRSTDSTLQQLEKLKQAHPQGARLQIVTIEVLPSGWLGKNHAMYQGALLASHEWLLFTDADIIFAPETLQKSLSCVSKNNLDHLTLIPQNEAGTFLYKAFHSYWSILGVWNFIQLRHAGIGAFNLIRKEVYENIGTHNNLRLTPDDDLKLGKRIVSMGYRQQLGFGRGLISVQWYENIPQVVKGLEKNLFAFMRYSIAAASFFSLCIFVLHVLPFFGLLFFPSPSGYFFTAAAAIYFMMYWINQKYAGENALYFIFMPWNGLLFIYCLLRSTFRTLVRGGVEWRGTVYSLKELRNKNK